VKNNEEVICQFCSKEVVAKGSNTSNLISHLRVHHLLNYIDVQKMQKEKTEKASKTGANRGSDAKQTTITSTIEKLKKYDRSSKKWKQLMDSVTYFLAKDILPAYTVEKEGFQRFVKAFDSQYQVPSQKYFAILLYQLCMLQLKKRYLIVYQVLNILLQSWICGQVKHQLLTCLTQCIL